MGGILNKQNHENKKIQKMLFLREHRTKRRILPLRYFRSMWTRCQDSQAERRYAETYEGGNELNYQDEEADLVYEGWLQVEHGKYAGMYIREDTYIFES